MAKPADYFISAVQYDFEHVRILNVKRHLDRGEFVARGNIVNRNIVYNDLKKGLKYQTIYRDENNKWMIGKDVLLDSKTGIISIDPENSSGDNLGSLPEF